MVVAAPYGGRRLIADTSAWEAIHRARLLGNVPSAWTQAIVADQILTSPVVRIEILHSTRNLAEFDDWNERLSILREVPLTNPACLAAIAALRELAAVQSKYHRVGLGDALIAASAQDVNAADGVLHYNHKDFAKLAEVLEFDDVPLAPAGTFEAGV
jgi:predicted nucleic acid-binding protein